MKMEWKNPKTNPSFLEEGKEYLLLKNRIRFFANFNGFDSDGNDTWERVHDDYSSYETAVDGYYDFPYTIKEQLGVLDLNLCNAENQKKLGKKMVYVGTDDMNDVVMKEIVLSDTQKVELEQKINSLRKEIERTYELLKLSRKSND